MQHHITLETGRFVLRPWVIEDAAAFLAIFGEAEITRHLLTSDPLTDMEDARASLDETIATKRVGWRFAVQEKESGEVVGNIVLKPLDQLDEFEIAWHTRLDQQRRGIASEAARQVLDWGHSHLGLDQIVAIIRSQNPASLGLASKLGLRADGEMEYRGHLFKRFLSRQENLALPPTQPTLVSERLVLSPWTMVDTQPFFGLYSQPEITKHLGPNLPHSDPAESGPRLAAILSRPGRCWWWKVALRGKPDEVIGSAIMQDMPDGTELEIGWHLAPSAWGKGYAREFAQRLLQFAFEDLDQDHVVAILLPANERSRNVALRIGMTYLGNLDHKGFHVEKYRLDRKDVSA